MENKNLVPVLYDELKQKIFNKFAESFEKHFINSMYPSFVNNGLIISVELDGTNYVMDIHFDRILYYQLGD